jgi:hypothetical protein
MKSFKTHCFSVTVAVLTVIAVFQDTNYCVKCVEGGPSTSRGFNSSSWIEPRRCFSEQLVNCLSIRTQSAEIVNLRNFRLQQPTRGNAAWI